MKTRLIAVIIICGIIFTGTGYLYDQMYDCLFPPIWMKLPRSYSLGDCLQKYGDGTLPDWTQAREDFAQKQTQNMEVIERFKDLAEVKAFFSKYEDANASVRHDHVSYSAGNDDDFRVRMNLFFGENYELDHIDFHCYFQREHQFELAQEQIASKLAKYDCKKSGT